MNRKALLVYQLKFELRGSQPLIWRRVEVLSSIALQALHTVLQIAMGWENYHSHAFRIKGTFNAKAEPLSQDLDVSSERRRLDSILAEVGSSIGYVYDFDDNWWHDIVLEGVAPVKRRKLYPVCIGGDRAAPPEDVGGISGYEFYLTALLDPKHAEHRSMKTWGGRFNPAYFSRAAVNKGLRKAFPQERLRPSPRLPGVSNNLLAR